MAVYLIFILTGIDLNDHSPQETQQVNQVSRGIEANSSVVRSINYSEEGFSLVVPRGNSSSCVWTWVAGTGDIPGSETTNSTSGESNLHKLVTDLFNGRDFKVGCTNDYGEYYQGIFIDEPS